MRKNFIAIFFIAVLAVTASAAVLSATEDAKKPVTNKICPVSGGPVSADYRGEYKGQYVYVCCKGCLDEFKADPEKFVAKMSKEERELIKTNELCLVSKEPVKQEFWSEDNGRKVYFCCAGCKTSFDKKAAANKKS
jgi:YHS domain-containing protein